MTGVIEQTRTTTKTTCVSFCMASVLFASLWRLDGARAIRSRRSLFLRAHM